MEANFEAVSSLSSISKDYPSSKGKSKMEMGATSSVAEEIAPATETAPKNNQFIMGMGKSSEQKPPAMEIAVPRVGHFRARRRKASVRCGICGVQGHNRHPASKLF